MEVPGKTSGGHGRQSHVLSSERKDAEYAALAAPPSQGLGEKAVRPSSFKAERGGSVSETQKGMVLAFFLSMHMLALS